MATISGWTPFGEAVSLRDAMDRLFEQSYLQPRRNGGQQVQQAWRIPMDVYETPSEFVIRAWAPGVEPGDMNIVWEQGTVTIRGKLAPAPEAEQRVVWHARELAEGEAYASVSLPGQVDVDRATATFSNGLLTLRVPKAEAVKPRQIKLQSSA